MTFENQVFYKLSNIVSGHKLSHDEHLFLKSIVGLGQLNDDQYIELNKISDSIEKTNSDDSEWLLVLPTIFIPEYFYE